MRTFVLLCGYLILSLGFLRATPVLEASDEARHFAMALLLAETRTLPRGSLTARTIAEQEAVQPPLYYALGAVVLGRFDTAEARKYLAMTPGFVVGRADLPGPRNMFTPRSTLQVDSTQVETAIVLLRLVSVALGLGVVLFTCLSFRQVVPDAPQLAPIAGALIAFNPMFLFIHASFNNDCLLNFIAAGVVYGVVRTAHRRPSVAWAAALGVVLGLAALTKLSGLVLVPPVLFYLFLRRDSLAGVAIRSGALLLGLAAVASWWFLRNYVLYGSFTAAEFHTALAGNGRGDLVPLALLFEWDGFVKSIWGVFGGFNIIYPDGVYYAFYAMSLLLVGLAGWGLMAQMRTRRPAEALFLAALVAVNLAGVAYWTSFLLGSQGRFLFPSISAWSVLAVGGVARLPGPWRTGICGACVGLLVVCSGWAAFSLIPRSYLP
jgi:4-amino-4-deoxy-L-arabinose transferase-like glycosyltransferase